MSDYLVYWKPSTVAENEAVPIIQHSASNQYGKVSIGDILWIVTSEGPNDLLLIGGQRVDHVVGQLEAERRLQNPSLWEAEYHVLSDNPEEKANLNISRWAFQLEFNGDIDQFPDGFTGQHLQSMRRLDFSSARVLEGSWSRRNDTVD